MADPNHDIVPTLRMFDGLMMNQAADEIERLRNAIEAAIFEVKSVRRFHFAHNPPNTGLAAGFNSILAMLGDPEYAFLLPYLDTSKPENNDGR